MSNIYTDMMGRRVEISSPPRRIISLVPSQTELLYDLGLDEEVVGITKFCVHPQSWFRNKKRVGGTKTVHAEIINELKPDLIIASKEENTREQVEALAALYPVWISDIKTIAGGLHMIQAIGEFTGRSTIAQQLVTDISTGFASLQHNSHRSKPARIAYFIWRKPWMCAGGDTFISDMITAMGGINVFAGTPRYPQVELAELCDKDVDTVLLSSEPYPFKDAHIAEIRAVLPHARVLLADGEMFSWYGSRMKYAVPYLQSMEY